MIRMAAFILGFHSRVHTTTRSTFMDDLKDAVLLAGCDGEELVWTVSAQYP